jgi:hypothetical protein
LNEEKDLRSDGVSGRSSAPAGKTLEIRVAQILEGQSGILAVTNCGTICAYVHERAKNAGILIDFMRRLVKG